MAVAAPSRRPTVAVRRTGYVVAAAVNLSLLYLANVWPGWSAVPVLTDDTAAVLGLFNASLVVGAALNVMYVAYDAPWLKALGDLATAGIGLAVLTQVWRVFPFDFDESTVDWTLVARVALVVAIVATAIAMVTNLVKLVRAVATPSGR